MAEPPSHLDGARVLHWAWSDTPFFSMPDGDTSIDIHGLAVCRYDSGAIYRFSCDAEWNVEHDAPHDTVDAALRAPSAQFDIASVDWRPIPFSGGG